MRSLILFSCLSLLVQAGNSQDFHSLLQRSPGKAFDHILVEQLNSDEHGTTFLIWVKDQVAAHFHESHTEHVYILAGKGIMRIGEVEREISEGDLLFIPQGMVHSLKVTSDQPMQAMSIQTPEFLGSDRHFVEE